MVRISIIIPTQNEEKYLPALLDSISCQTFKDLEVIVSDSGSTDTTIKYAKKHRCRTIAIKNGSPAKGRNAGAKIAKGEILVFIDADCKLADNSAIARFYWSFKEKRLGVASCIYVPDSDHFSYRLMYSFANLWNYLMQYISPFATGYFIACTRNIYSRLDGFDESLFVWEDYDFVRRASRLGKFRIIPVVIKTSVRRFIKDKWYPLKTVYAYIYTFFFGKIRNPIYNYDFGNKS